MQRFTNPILDEDFPDPTFILALDGCYYAYGTQTKRQGHILNLQVIRSRDLISWEHLGEGMPEKPVWAATTQRIWAPHVSCHGGIYYLYYSAQPDAGGGLCLAVAMADNPAGPFRDVGQPLLCGEGFLNIDPMAYDDPATGQRLLYWGSGFGPLRVQALAEDRLSFAPGSVALDLVHPNPADAPDNYERLLEGSWVHFRAGWYYLFYSGNDCCGDQAHYGVMVARARHATGPFQTLSEATGGRQITILSHNERWLAPGHNCVVTDAAGQDWMAYHAIDREQPAFDAINNEQGYSRRVLLLDRLQYVDGWPQVGEDGTPTIGEQPAPSAG